MRHVMPAPWNRDRHFGVYWRPQCIVPQIDVLLHRVQQIIAVLDRLPEKLPAPGPLSLIRTCQHVAHAARWFAR